MAPTRTWLTTPPGAAPDLEGRTDDQERYVPGPGLVREPRIPGRHERSLVAVGLLLVIAAAVIAAVVAGQASQREDPSIPDAPADPAGDADPGGDDGILELPES